VIVLWAVALGCILVGSTWSAGVQRGVIKRRFSVHTHESGGGGAAVDGTGGRGGFLLFLYMAI
jgi:hypothetical protein